MDVLLICGEEDVREVFRAGLRLHHFRVKAEARGRRQARGLLRAGARGVTILDTELADGERGDVLAKAQEYRSRLPVVLVSPRYGKEFEEKAKRLGASAIRPRPFEIPELLAAIEEATGGE